MVDADGTKRTGDIRVSETSLLSTNPAIAWSGARFGIVWSDVGEVPGNAEIWFRAYNHDGVPVGDAVRVTVLDGSSNLPSLAWSGSEYGLAWQEEVDGNREVYFARLDVAGVMLGTPIRVTNNPAASETPRIVWNGTGWGIVWTDRRHDGGEYEVYFRGLDPAGGFLTPEKRLADTGGNSVWPRVAWTGEEYAVAWQEDLGSGNDIVVLRVSAAGISLGLPLTLPSPGPSEFPIPAWTGVDFGLSWTENDQIVFGRLGCDCPDQDGDGISTCNECADGDSTVFPGAPQLCDGVNNDCADPEWPAVPAFETDDDGDGLAECQGDCDDTSALVHPGAPQLCDGVNNDCGAPEWPAIPRVEADDDGDGLSECQGDCDDTAASVYPGAPQLCDGVNNDCNDGAWPTVSSLEADADGDGFRACAGDCDDSRVSTYPGAPEICNSIDDDCDGLIDEDELGEDTDGDGIRNACDNCRDAVNPSQLDSDLDGLGNSCDNCVALANPDQTDIDFDGRGDLCDNCPTEFNPSQADFDGDRHGNACDNCLFDYNPAQTDSDGDSQGDFCDLDDGIIYILFSVKDFVDWQEEIGYDAWNSYRGDLTVLQNTGVYTQSPGSSEFAAQQCGLVVPSAQDMLVPGPGQVAFYLTTGTNGGESDLGMDSAGVLRPNDSPCP